MKRYLYLLIMAFIAIQFQSCSDDDGSGESISELEKNYLTIENAVFNKGEIPAATISEPLDGIDMSTQVMNGAMNYISVVTEKAVNKFFVGIKNIDGYFAYVPTNMGSVTDYNMYVIPVMMSDAYRGNATVVLSGELATGGITIPVEKAISYIETKTGAIEIKLAFSNSKDIDIHLYTPSGEHIYYGNRGGTYTKEDGTQITYGLDIDSNAGCHLDNINKENIYIPEELVENGTYRVVVDMYNNCKPSIATSWSIVARYQGDIITPATGVNPASGIYQAGAGNGDMTQVMTFTINNATKASARSAIMPNSFKAVPLSDIDEMKVEEAKYRSQW